ncbi:MAG: hypothetical protein ABIP21_06710 [Acidimicrobiia bacterium]
MFQDEGGRRLVLRLLAATSADALNHDGLVAPEADANAIDRQLGLLRDAPNIDVLNVRRNGRRVDARLRADNGSDWLVVAWASHSTLEAIESVTVYERPEPFRGRSLGLVIVLNGPSSVGKSSLMRAFADSADTPFACLDEPSFGRLPAAFTAWPDTLGPHVDGVLAALAAAARFGNQFLVSAAGISQQRFRAALTEVPTLYVGLDAPLDVLVARQLSQADKYGGLAEESVDIHHGWNYDLRIDTAQHRPADAARLLLQRVDSLS